MENNAFDKIVETEKNSDAIIAEAKEKASSIKKAALDIISELEKQHREELADYQKSLSLNENVAMAVQSTEAEAKWNEQRKSMDEVFENNKETLINEMLRKVVD